MPGKFMILFVFFERFKSLHCIVLFLLQADQSGGQPIETIVQLEILMQHQCNAQPSVARIEFFEASGSRSLIVDGAESTFG